MPSNWDECLLAYLHDPPDKALAIQGHETRAAQLASQALGRAIDARGLHGDTRTEDQLASLIERAVPLPTAGDNGERAVKPEDTIHLFHPLSGLARNPDLSGLQQEKDALLETLEEVLEELEPPWARYLAVWRLWRDRLVARRADWGRLPADTRLPDHTIWNHLDTAAGLRPILGQGGPALLSFSVGPVQAFIAAAQSVRDLWTGSYLLAWLTFAALRPILEKVGPAVILSPALRGNPLMDRWLRNLSLIEAASAPHLLAKPVRSPDPQLLLSPCLPNRFTAFVPWGQDGETAREMAQLCESSCRQAWSEIAQAVHGQLAALIQRPEVPHAETWDRLWPAQVSSFFEVRTVVLPLNSCDDSTLARLLDSSGNLERALGGACAVRTLEKVLKNQGHHYSFAQDTAGQWGGRMDVLGRLAESARAVRHIPAYQPEPDTKGQWPPKCSLQGTYEQMGPAGLKESEEFWQAFAKQSLEGTRIRSGERLCAISLIKRFAWAAYLHERLGLEVRDLRYPDTATVASKLWLAEGKPLDPEKVREENKDWSGQWLHWPGPTPRDREDENPIPGPVWDCIRDKRKDQGPAPAYYAILMLDGDGLGKWIRGENGPTVERVLHPKLTRYYQQKAGTNHSGLKAPRPVGPAFQAALSEALTNFALHFVPAIVKDHQGTLIYAGGDDVLALLPTRTALACARKLEKTYRQEWATDGQGMERLLMGSEATVSAGLAVVHYKEDLRFALQAAREAEKAAKKAGRNALTVRVCRRSGEDSQATLAWKQVPDLEKLVEFFMEGVSDRWCYHLRAELTTLAGGLVPWDAAEAEVGRLLQRLDNPDENRRRIFQERVKKFLTAYRSERNSPERQKETKPLDHQGKVLEDFTILCQSASFLARGREQR